jgi:hypothetical protein
LVKLKEVELMVRAVPPDAWQTLPVATRKLPDEYARDEEDMLVEHEPEVQVLDVRVGGVRALLMSYATTTP